MLFVWIQLGSYCKGMIRKIMATLTTTMLLGGCFQIQNSFERDKELYSYQPELDLTDPAQLRLQKVRDLFVSYNCVSCHATNPRGFQAFLTYTNEDWTRKTCIGHNPCAVAGKATESYIYQKINQADCTPGNGLCNMPSQMVQMAPADLAVIEDWIQELE